MALYSPPPPAAPFSEAKPTLLVAWWITIFCTCLVLLRLVGRYVRVEKLFLEDKIVAVALIPLYLRIACTHIVLLYGTNNAQLAGLSLSDEALAQRVTGSRVVLASRIFYAATLWALKFTTLEFLNRLAGASRQKVYLRLIVFLRYTLVATFLAVLISDLAECRPTSHYWQVMPDPGPQCRQGFAQLLTMGVSSIITDMILAVFPVPIVLSTRIPTRRKVLLVLLFCFGFVTVGITAYRMPRIIQHSGDQVTRSMWASVELLAATTVANLTALGSFLRDTGAKKTKFRQDFGSSGATTSRRQMRTHDSDFDDDEPASKRKTAGGASWADAEHHGEHTDARPESRSEDGKCHPVATRDRGVSPTESHDSLIHSHVLGEHLPRRPPPVITATKGLQQR